MLSHTLIYIIISNLNNFVNNVVFYKVYIGKRTAWSSLLFNQLSLYLKPR